MQLSRRYYTWNNVDFINHSQHSCDKKRDSSIYREKPLWPYASEAIHFVRLLIFTPMIKPYFFQLLQTIFFFFYFLILRQSQLAGEGLETEGERIPGRLHAVPITLNMGLDPTNCENMTRAEIKSWTLNQQSHPGAPYEVLFLVCLQWSIFSNFSKYSINFSFKSQYFDKINFRLVKFGFVL